MYFKKSTNLFEMEKKDSFRTTRSQKKNTSKKSAEIEPRPPMRWARLSLLAFNNWILLKIQYN